MNEEALKDAYSLFTNTGYNGTQDEFYTLLSDNAEAFADSYGLFKDSGYNGSEDDYKELLGLKKKDASVLQDLPFQMDTKVSASESQEPTSSLDQRIDDSLNKRLASIQPLQDGETDPRMEASSFFEEEGLDFKKYLSLVDRKFDIEKELKSIESSDEKPTVNPFAKTESSFISSLNKGDQALLKQELSRLNAELDPMVESADKAKRKYDNAKYYQLKSTVDPSDLDQAVIDADIDKGNIKIPNLVVGEEIFSLNEYNEWLYKRENVNAIQEDPNLIPEQTIEFLKNSNNKALNAAYDLTKRQILSGGEWGDKIESLESGIIGIGAGAVEMIAKGSYAALDALSYVPKTERLEVGLDDPETTYSSDFLEKGGSPLANRLKEKQDELRANIRAYEESSITESLLKGNILDAVNQGGNALMESAPLTASLMLAGPLGVSQTATLFGAGIVSAGQNELELLSQREEGRDIADWQINLSNLGSFAGEYIGERYTLGLINDARRLASLDKMLEPDAVVDSFVKGVTKGFGIEAASEGFTETINYLTDSAVGLEDFDLTKFGIRIADASIIGGFSGAGIHTSIRTGKAVSRAITNLEIIDENTTVIFKYADNKTEELSRTDAIKLVRKDPELRQQIRDGVVKADYSMNEVARKAIEDLVYGYYAPDAETNRAKMREKEKVVQNLSDAVKEDPSLENINKLSNAISEMEAEAKVSEYNESKSTEATRAKTKNIFNEKGVEIIDAMKSQDVSQSKVTETTEVDKIENKDQYESAKKQIKNNKVPKLVTSQTQTGVKVEGELLQTSEVTQGKFKSMNAAKNAIKDYEAKIKAQEKGQMLEEELSPLNNKLFIETNKEALDEVPKEVLDSKDYYILTSEKEGLNRQERKSRMSELTSILDDIGATYYKVKGVYNGVAEESLIVTGISEADALNAGRDFGQESIFSAKKGLMFSDGRVVPLNDSDLKGPKARSKDALTIMNVGGRKMSLHSGLDWSNTSYGKNFNSENVHRLDENDPNYDKELLEGVTQDRKRVLGFVLKFLNSIGGLNVTVIRNSEAMQSQIKSIQKDRYIKNGMSEEKAEVEANKYASERRGGSFFLDKTIYVNLETVRGNTLFHEIIHPMVDFIKKTDPALYKRIEAEVAEGKVKRRTTKGGRKIKGSYLEWAQNNPAYASLSREEQIEEAFAEMMGDAAYGHFKNKGTRLNRLREVIKAILTKLGVTSLPENVEAIDLDDMSLSDIRTNLAEALVDGRKVNVGGVEFEVGETDAESRFQLDAIDRRTQVQYTYDVNSKEFSDMEADGLITSGMTIQDFAGKTMMIHSPDATFSGSIIDKDGTILVEGKGGIYYTFKHNEGGYFWASTDNAANSMAKQLNSMLEANGGKIYMGLTTAREGKLLSNTAMSRGVVNLFTSPNFISKIGLSKPTLYKALIDAANQTSPLGDGLKLGLKPYRASSKFEGGVLEKVWDKLDNKKTSFKDRKFFTDKFLTLAKQSLESGSSKTNFVNFIKTTMGDESLVKFNNKGEPNVKSMKKALVNVLTEPELRGEEVTDKVYAVLEIDGPVKAIKTDEYESYGTAIVSESGNRAKIHRLDNREFWYDVAEDPMTNTVIGETTGRSGSGQISSRRSQIMPSTAGVSMTPLKISESIRMQAPTYEMEYTPNSLVSLAMLSDNNRQPEQWIKEIGKGLKGASKDVDTMGLLDILKAYKKDAKVKSISKEVVAQLIATNMADIETKILGGDIDYDNYDIDYDGDNYSITTPDGVTLRSDMEIVKDIEDLTTEEANSIIEETLKAENLGPVYSEVTLPGGENYREFLIKDKSPEDIFKAPHYDDFGQNLIASARVDDRVGPNGEKILFVQEIQSDWAQRAADKKKSGEKIGFKKDNPPLTKEEVNEMGDLSATYNRAINEQVKGIKDPWVEDLLFESGGYRVFELLKKVNERISNSKPTEDLKNYQRYLQLQIKESRFEDAIADLPWGQTDLWVGLTIRKLINQASKEGYDQIAFVNGEQSDIIQGHSDGRTAEFYNKIVPKNINNELKRLVKGMKYGVGEVIEDKVKPLSFGDFKEFQGNLIHESDHGQYTIIDQGDGTFYWERPDGKEGVAVDFEDAVWNLNVYYNSVQKLEVANKGESLYSKNATINLTPELKAATDKVGPLRFQAPQEEGESNVYTDGLVSIGWDISKAMQDLNYMSGTYLTGFIDQKAFDSKDKQRYDIKLTTLLAKPFGTHSDKEVKEIMVRSRGALNSAIIEANEVGKRLKELNEKYNYTEQELNDFLHDHNKIKALEDSDIKNTLIEMRMSIDDLSKTLIAEDLIAGQTMFTVDSNLGLYVTKAYKNFEVKGWEQTDNLIIQKTKDFLYKEAKKDNPEATEERLNDIVKVNYRKLNSDKNFAYNIKNGGSLDGLSRLTSIFKQRKEIPQEIRDFWGEIDDPIFNYNNTVKKIAQTITAERMYKDLYEIGNGKFISDTQTSETFNKLVGSKWGSLEGKFVDNEMFAVMNQMSPEKGEGLFNFVYDKYMELVLLNKKTKTVWNIGTHFKNVIGNTAFATMNGHIGFRGGMFKDAWASLKAVASSSDAELNAIRKNLIEKGVLSSSASLEEIRNISKDLGDTDYDLSKYLDEKNGKIQKLMSKSVRYVGKPLKYLDDKFTRAYQAEDDVWKFYGFLSEKARYIEAGLSEKEADDMAARNIINLYPNYNEIPRIIRYIGRSPIVGSFVAFQSESFRNAKNTVKLGFEEMGSSNPKIKRIGTTRIAGTIATMTLLEGLQLYTMQFLSQALGLAGGDEEESEERRLRTMVAEWDRDGSLAYVDSGVLDSKTNENQMENDKYFDYINFSSISGVGHIRDILRLSFTDIDTEVGKESAYSIVKKMFEPFLGEEMTLATFLEAYENKGDRIYSRTDDAATATLKMIEYVGKKVAMPGIGRNAIRIMESFEQDSERVPTYETLALFGLRISRTNLNKTLSINARNAYNDMRSRSSDSIIRDKTLLLNEIKNNPDLDNDLNIIADLMAGCRLNKVAGRDTKAILKGMGISDVVIDLAYNRMLKNYKQDVLSVDAK